MNLFHREWQFYRKQTIYWCIGILALIFIAFFKVSGMNSTPGGVEEVLKSLPPMLQAFLGAGAQDFTSGVGSYSMIHLYVVITLALHAALLGSSLFAKEELDKTYEFLYVKGVKRWRILTTKLFAGIAILLVVDLLCLLSIVLSTVVMNMSLDIGGLMPYIASLGIIQLFFLAFALTCSLWLRNAQKAGMISCCLVLVMFLISMYVKVGGNANILDTLSLFHYTDTAYIVANGYGGISSFVILLLTLGMIVVGEWLHERRDLL